MSETWLQEYIFLAFRIHKMVQKMYGCPFVEAHQAQFLWRSRLSRTHSLSLLTCATLHKEKSKEFRYERKVLRLLLKRSATCCKNVGVF